ASVAPSGPRPLRFRPHPNETAAWGSPFLCVRELAVARMYFVSKHCKRDGLQFLRGNSVDKESAVLEVPKCYTLRRGMSCTTQPLCYCQLGLCGLLDWIVVWPQSQAGSVKEWARRLKEWMHL
ncbi:hypothetical protein CPAR01_13771, partial [Colletotrichum paranaense]